MQKEIRISVRAADLVPLDRLRIIQDDLKSLSKQNYNRLRGEIIDRGFSFAFHVWNNGKTLDILDGTQRYRVLSEMEKSEGYAIPGGVPVNYVEATSEREAVLKVLGGAGMYGTPEDEGLYALMVKHNITMGDIANIQLPGIDLPTFEQAYFEDPNASEGEDEVPEPPVEPKTRLGDLYKLGDHRLLCGDSTKREDVERLMGGEKADMVFTDPPYGMGLDTDYSSMHSGGGTASTSNPYQKGKKFPAVIGDDRPYDPGPIFEMFGYCKEIFLWGGDYYYERLPSGGTFMVWDKNNGNEGADKMIGSGFEFCWTKQKHKKSMCRIFYRGTFGEDKQRVHPTQKPASLAKWFFERWGKDAKIIWDGYLGSGSTLIACEKTSRRCFGIEIDPAYCDVILERWEKFSGKSAIREDGTPWAQVRGA